MLRCWLLIAIMMISACVSHAPRPGGVEMSDFIDSGQFNAQSIAADKLIVLGSRLPRYRNIDAETVASLDQALAQLLLDRYGSENLGMSVEAGRFSLSYEVLKNRVSTVEREVEGRVCLESARHVALSLQVLDLQSSEVVWGGMATKSLSDNSCATRSESDNANFGGYLIESVIGSIVEGIFGSASDAYPEPPDLELVVNMIFYEFYQRLP